MLKYFAVVFSLQALVIECAVLKSRSYYQSIAENTNIDKLKLSLGELEKPDFDIYTEFFQDWKSHARNDDHVLKCLIDHSTQISTAITGGQESTRLCIKTGQDKLISLGEIIIKTQNTIRSLLDDLKMTIPSCASANKNSTAALDCIHKKGSNIHGSLEKSVRTIEDALLKGHEAIESTKACLFNAATVTVDNLVTILVSISGCMGEIQQ